MMLSKTFSWVAGFALSFLLVSGVRVGAQSFDFSLLNVDGKKVSLKNYPDAKGFIVVFTCNHCPFAKLYPKRLNALSRKYSSLDIPLLAISSTDTISYAEDTYENMQLVAKQKKYRFPYLYDADQSVARLFKADKTPHAFILWREQDGKLSIRYSGAIDDNGAQPKKVTEHYVADAADDLLVGRPVRKAQTSSIGCKIYFRK
jgi:peroxiredoxin